MNSTNVDGLAVTRAMLSPDDARDLTDRIKEAAEQLWTLLLNAYEGQAWRALEYPSWRDYAQAEFGMSQSYAYRILDQGRVIRALEATADSPIGEIISEHIARQVKPHLPLVTNEIRERIAAGEATQTAVINSIDKVVRNPHLTGRMEGQEPQISAVDSKAQTIEATRRRYSESRRRKDRSNRIVENIVMSAKFLLDMVPESGEDTMDGIALDFSELDAACIPEWTEELRESARQIARFAARLEKTVPARRAS